MTDVVLEHFLAHSGVRQLADYEPLTLGVVSPAEADLLEVQLLSWVVWSVLTAVLVNYHVWVMAVLQRVVIPVEVVLWT